MGLKIFDSHPDDFLETALSGVGLRSTGRV